MAGELNASHMGSVYKAPVTYGDDTASLGLYYDHAYTGPGMKIADYLKTGPAGRADTRPRPGAMILAVNGEPIRADMDIHPLLNRLAGQPVRLTLQPAGGGAPVHEIVTPEPFVNSLVKAHERWVAQRQARTERLSKGRLGYVYIGGMETANYQKFVNDLFGRYADKEAVIVDVRFNDSSIFPHLYKQAQLGSFVGEPVPGTGTAVWWIDLLPGGRFKYGIPEIGHKSPDGRFFENTEDEPDVLVRRSPNAIEEGRDEPLERAVEQLLGQLDGSPVKQ